MAKRLLQRVLEEALGDFISDLSSENLKLAVWGGKLEFHNLVIRPGPMGGALRDLGLPVAVLKGFIKHIDVTIPWASLGKSPVRIIVEDFLLQLRPLESAEYPSAEETMESKLNAKKNVLMAELKTFIESLISAPNQQSQPALKSLMRILLASKRFASIASVLNTSKKSKSYFQRLLTKILDNIEISVSSVHVRYEDSVSLPDRVISAGFTLREFVVASADDNWQVRTSTMRGVSTSSEKFSMRKLFNLKHVCVYCDSIEPVTFEHINPLQVQICGVDISFIKFIFVHQQMSLD